MDLKQMLKNLGYTDEQIQAVLNAMRENGIYTSTVENPDETINELQRKYDGLMEKHNTLQSTKKDDLAAGKTIEKLQNEIRKGKIETAAIIELIKEGAADVDYLMFKAERTGELQKLKVDENGKVVGASELADSLKKNYASQFSKPASQQDPLIRTGIKKLDEAELPDNEPKTLEEAIAQKFSETDD